jgi:hypothetical protein
LEEAHPALQSRTNSGVREARATAMLERAETVELTERVNPVRGPAAARRLGATRRRIFVSSVFRTRIVMRRLRFATVKTAVASSAARTIPATTKSVT